MPRPADDVSTLLAQHGQQLFALLVRLTLRYDVAEDLLQELFCKLATSSSFQQADNPLAYAHRTATNLAFDWRRSKKHLAIADSKFDGFAAPSNSPLTDLVRREELDQVLNKIATLSTPGREIIVLRYFEHESYESIAKQLGKTTHQVRAICFKAIRKLRTSVNDPEGVAAISRRLKSAAITPPD